MVRSTAVGWDKGCLLAVDAGVHLAAIIKILEDHELDRSDGHITLVNGPFEGFRLISDSMKANATAAYITRQLVDTYLITHPHLDHISGFVISKYKA